MIGWFSLNVPSGLTLYWCVAFFLSAFLGEFFPRLFFV